MKIALTQCKEANVDQWFYKHFGGNKWFSHNMKTSTYAGTNLKVSSGKYKTLHMHNLVMWRPLGYEVDHINGDGLDNRTENLRVVTRQQNQFNRKPSGKSSKYKGVYMRKDMVRKWLSRVCKNGKYVHYSSHKSEIEAAETYDKYAKIYHGEYANLNFPNKK